MRHITVKIESDRADDNTGAPITVEEDRGAGQVRIDGKTYTPGKDKEMVFHLRQGQRLVIDAYTAEAVAYDRDQGAAYIPKNQASTDGRLDSPLRPEAVKEKEELDKRDEAQRKAEETGKPAPPATAPQAGAPNAPKPGAPNPSQPASPTNKPVDRGGANPPPSGTRSSKEV